MSRSTSYQTRRCKKENYDTENPFYRRLNRPFTWHLVAILGKEEEIGRPEMDNRDISCTMDLTCRSSRCRS